MLRVSGVGGVLAGGGGGGRVLLVGRGFGPDDGLS